MSFYYSPKIVTDGLVLYLDAGNSLSYPGSGTTWTDLSRSMLSGSLINGPTYSSANGGSIVFDGANDYALVPNSSVFTVSEVTIGAWFLSKKDVKNYITTKQNDSWYVGIGPGGTTSGKLSFYVEGTTGGWLQSTTTITQNQWYYGVCTFKSNTSSIYVNGTLDISATRTGTIPNGTAPVYIANRPDDSSANFLGNLSNIQIYNRALTAQEVLQNYNATKTRFGL